MDTNQRDALDLAAAAGMAFRNALPDRKQRPDQTYAEALAAFDAPTPEHGTGGRAVIEDLVTRATPGLHAMAGPRFFGWVIGSSHPVGVAADWLTSAWGQNAGNHTASPAASAAETVASRWLLDLLDLPRTASVGFVTGATVANFVGLAAARAEVLRRAGWDLERQGLWGAPPLRVLIGAEAHATVFAGLHYLGFGEAQLVKLGVDDQGRMSAEEAARELAADPGPTILVTQAGQINTGAFDPHVDLIAAARPHPNCWVHVDGAFGLWARACPSRAHLGTGIEGADSWATDGHKWLQTPYDSGFAIVRDADAHRRAMTIAASYLPPVAEGDRDPSHYVPELSRRARGFATWAMIRHLGRSGIAEMIERHCRLAKLMADELAAEPGIALVNTVALNQAVLRFGADAPPEDGDLLTKRTIEALQRDGTCFAGGAKWRDRWVLRLSVIGGETTTDDAVRAVEAIKAAWREVRGGTGRK